MVDYVLAWLAANNVDEVFIFCCAHAELVIQHVEKYGGRLAGGAALHTVVSTACTSAGEALRLIYEQNIVRTDFVLMTADTLANFHKVSGHQFPAVADESLLRGSGGAIIANRENAALTVEYIVCG